MRIMFRTTQNCHWHRYYFLKFLLADSKADLSGECWICYDTDTLTNGPLIHPCDCKGDVAAVHHNCLRKWLMEVCSYFITLCKKKINFKRSNGICVNVFNQLIF